VSAEDGPWRDRIIGYGTAVPHDLIANPANWRQHPLHQREALRDVLDRVGWVQSVVINQRSGHLVDGHLRVQLAGEREEPNVPVLYVDLTDEEERLVLATLDPLAQLAVPDVDQLRALLDSLPSLDEAEALGGMLEDLLGQFTANTPDGTGEPASEEDFWPVIRLQVSYDTFRAFEAWWAGQPGGSDDEKVRELLDA
jgi:hypothetical protein